MSLTLSNFFPKGTQYFYSFPAGDDSSFFNKVPAYKEELVSARPLVCAGKHVSVVTFYPMVSKMVADLAKDLKIETIPADRVIALPEMITADVTGRKRNAMVGDALTACCADGALVMAQPLSRGAALAKKYCIAENVVIWCNDKKNMPEYIKQDYLPERYETYSSGKEFFESKHKVFIPCVVKVASSSSGDGVRICHTMVEFEKAKKAFKKVKDTIFIEEYIDAAYNLGVQFGVPYDKKQPITIIGFNEQLIGVNGQYLGAIIEIDKKIKLLSKIKRILLKEILPKIRKKGWYGVGGIDVLIGKDGAIRFIDGNFRMTAMSAYFFLIKNKVIKQSMVSFFGSYRGSEEAFRKDILPLVTKEKKLKLITLANTKGVFYFNAAMFFKNRDEIKKNSRFLLGHGIHSAVLKRLKFFKNV